MKIKDEVYRNLKKELGVTLLDFYFDTLEGYSKKELYEKYDLNQNSYTLKYDIVSTKVKNFILKNDLYSNN